MCSSIAIGIRSGFSRTRSYCSGLRAKVSNIPPNRFVVVSFPATRSSIDQDKLHPKWIHPVIDRLADAGVPVDKCCQVLGVSR